MKSAANKVTNFFSKIQNSNSIVTLNSENDCDSAVILNSVPTSDTQDDSQQTIASSSSTQHEISIGNGSDADYSSIWS